MAYSETEQQKLVVACQGLPPNTVWEEERKIAESPVLTMMSTVLSLNRRWYEHAVPARRHFEAKYCVPSPPSLVDFVALVTRLSQSGTDWQAAAAAMWNMKESRKAEALFKLAQYFLKWRETNSPEMPEREALAY